MSYYLFTQCVASDFLEYYAILEASSFESPWNDHKCLKEVIFMAPYLMRIR